MAERRILRRALLGGALVGGLLVTSTPTSAAPVYRCAGQRATIVGTPRNDVLRGTSHRDVIVAREGNDRITSLGGNDLVCTGAGNDTVDTGGGNDNVFAGTGADTVKGSTGSDLLRGESGLDVLSGGAGNDDVLAAAGDDALFAGAGNDSCLPGTGNDIGANCENPVTDTFGLDGRVSLQEQVSGAATQRPIGMAVDADGNVVLAAQVPAANGGPIVVTRLHPDGRVDTDFGTGGLATIPVGDHGKGRAHVAGIDDEGRIVVAGTANFAVGGWDNVMIRLLDDGTLDPAFGDAGVLHTDSGATTPLDEPTALLLQPDGGMLVVGTAGTTESYVLAYEEDGDLDTNFDGDGKLVIDEPVDWPGGFHAVDAVMDGDGAITLGGGVEHDNDFQPATMRLLADGTPDDTYGDDGLNVLPGQPEATFIRAITLDGSGNLVVTGNADRGQTSFVGRLTDTGALDDTFGTDGVTGFDTSPSTFSEEPSAVAIDGEGRILVTGPGGEGGADWPVLRFDDDGDLDETFGVDGRAVPAALPLFEVLYPARLHVLDDGRLLVAGGNGASVLAVRFSADGTVIR